MEIFEKIALIRQLKGYSQEYVANEIGIAQNTYSLIERGKATLSVRRLELITDVLDIKPEILFSSNEQLFNELIVKIATRKGNSTNSNFKGGGSLPLRKPNPPQPVFVNRI